jgi:DNA repair protein RadC
VIAPLLNGVERGVDAGQRRRLSRVAEIADRTLSSRSEGELIANVLAGPEPAAEVLRSAVELAAVPFWRRRALGVAGLVAEHGVPAERAVRLAALWELAERWYPDDRPSVTSPRDALLLLDGIRCARRERIVVLMLDSRHRPIATEVVAVGTLNASRFTPRDVFGPALVAGAAAVLVAHNHPSGDPAPSRADRQVTAVLRQAGGLVGVPVVDHIVVARHGHFSFRESEGWVDGEPSPVPSNAADVRRGDAAVAPGDNVRRKRPRR